MTMYADDAETRLLELAQDLTEPRPRECVVCYVARMVPELSCDGTMRWVRHWRDRNAPRATALETRLHRLGAFCDCEVFIDGWPTGSDPLLCLDESWDQLDFVPPREQCLGVRRRGSTVPCRRWTSLAEILGR